MQRLAALFLITALVAGVQADDSSGGSAYSVCVNCGGSQFTDSSGNVFAADQAYVSGEFGYEGGFTATLRGGIAGTTDDDLYRAVRGALHATGAPFSYKFDIPDGEYEITLFFTEPFFEPTDTRKRYFDVVIEGVTELDDLDVTAEAGGAKTAHSETVTVDVADGQLNIDFISESIEEFNTVALVSAIQVVSTAPPPPTPDIRVTPTTVDFGTVIVGEYTEKTISIINDGDSTLTVSDFDSNNAAFEVISPTPSFDVLAGATQTVTLRYTAGASGPTAGSLTITSNDPDEGTTSVTLTGNGAAAPAGDEFRMNAGGENYVDLGGYLFEADRAYVAADFGFSGGSTSDFGGTAGTADDLYYTMRTGESFDFLVDEIPDGYYDVTLHFMEPTFTSTGLRSIDVTAEGALVVDGYDIYDEAGGKEIAVSTTFLVYVDDGRLNMEFAGSTSAVALVSGIEVVPGEAPPPDEPDINVSPTSLAYGQVVTGTTADLTVTIDNNGTAALEVTGLTTTNARFTIVGQTTPFSVAAGGTKDITVRFSPTLEQAETGNLSVASDDPDEATVTVSLSGTGVPVPALAWRLNGNGGDYTDGSGNLFVGDRAYSVGSFGWVGGGGADLGGPIANTTDDPLYTGVHGGSSFGAAFDVPNGDYDVILHFSEVWFTSAGGRQFDVSVEGTLELDNYDIVAEAGGKKTAITETITVTVTDGQLNVDLTAVVSSFAIISAIEVVEK